MSEKSIFSEDWRECLRSHYTHVVREQDVKTERTLRGVMHNVGFGDDELNELRVLATMHVDDVGADFVPDLQILEAVSDEIDVVTQTDEMPEAVLAVETPVDETVIDDDPVEETDEEEPPQYDASGPAQLTLF